MSEISEFGAALRAAREAKRLSRDAVARATGITTRNIARIEDGETSTPKDETIKTLAKLFPSLKSYIPRAA